MSEDRREALNKIRQEMGLPPIGFTAQPPGENQAEPPADPTGVTKGWRMPDEPMIRPEDVERLERWWHLPEIVEVDETEGEPPVEMV